eukprot:5568992-Prymnesium_polylepis.1
MEDEAHARAGHELEQLMTMLMTCHVADRPQDVMIAVFSAPIDQSHIIVPRCRSIPPFVWREDKGGVATAQPAAHAPLILA